jgi:hypothetical protein
MYWREGTLVVKVLSNYSFAEYFNHFILFYFVNFLDNIIKLFFKCQICQTATIYQHKGLTCPTLVLVPISYFLGAFFRIGAQRTIFQGHKEMLYDNMYFQM